MGKKEQLKEMELRQAYESGILSPSAPQVNYPQEIANKSNSG